MTPSGGKPTKQPSGVTDEAIERVAWAISCSRPPRWTTPPTPAEARYMGRLAIEAYEGARKAQVEAEVESLKVEVERLSARLITIDWDREARERWAQEDKEDQA